VIILDETKHQALAVVSESQLSLAIGKQGINVRLANRLVDWNIDVKTDAQFEDMDIAAESRRAVSELFGESDFEEEYTLISQLPGVDEAVAAILRENNKDAIEDFLALSEEELAEIGLSEEQQKILKGLIEEHVEIVEEEYDEEETEEEEIPAGEQEADISRTGGEEYECPDCGAPITVEMTNCPNCGIGLSFEYEDDNIEG